MHREYLMVFFVALVRNIKYSCRTREMEMVFTKKHGIFCLLHFLFKVPASFKLILHHRLLV